MHRWDRRGFGSLQSLNSFENFELLQGFPNVSKWIENFLFRNSSKQLQVHFINLVIFMHRWDRRGFGSLQSLNSFENFESLRSGYGRDRTLGWHDRLWDSICITEGHSMCVVREGLWISKFQEVWEVSSKFDIGFKLVRNVMNLESLRSGYGRDSRLI